MRTDGHMFSESTTVAHSQGTWWTLRASVKNWGCWLLTYMCVISCQCCCEYQQIRNSQSQQGGWASRMPPHAEWRSWIWTNTAAMNSHAGWGCVSTYWIHGCSVYWNVKFVAMPLPPSPPPCECVCSHSLQCHMIMNIGWLDSEQEFEK